MATGGIIDPKVMTIIKGGSTQRMSFSEGLKNSSALKAWNDHEDRFAEHYRSLINLDSDFEKIKEKQQEYSNSRQVLGNLYVKFIETRNEFEKEFEFGLPLLKEKYYKARVDVKVDLLKEVDKYFSKWTADFPLLDGIKRVWTSAKGKEEYLKYCRAADQWYRFFAEFHEKAKTLQELIEKGARATRVKLALPDIQDLEEKLKENLNQQKSCLKPYHEVFFEIKRGGA